VAISHGERVAVLKENQEDWERNVGLQILITTRGGLGKLTVEEGLKKKCCLRGKRRSVVRCLDSRGPKTENSNGIRKPLMEGKKPEKNQGPHQKKDSRTTSSKS